MARYTDAACRLCRREGVKLFLKGERCYSEKCAITRRAKAPGMHDNSRKKISEYGSQLREKQKTKRYYGVLEKQFRNTFAKADRMQGKTGDNLLRLLELRFDNVVYRMGFAASHAQARQLVSHCHFTVNGKKANIETDYILITLDNALEATDEIAITAFRNKDTDANGTLYMLFENGFAIDEGDNVVWNNVNEAIGQQPNTNTYKVAEGAGSKTIKLTRSKSSTNVFISKFIITRGGTDGIQNVEVVTPANNVIYNLSGQKVDASYKGIIIVNGKKVIF